MHVRSHNHRCCGQTVSIKNYECVSVALDIQHFKLTACSALLHFSTYLINGTISFKNKVTEHKIYVLIFFTTLI